MTLFLEKIIFLSREYVVIMEITLYIHVIPLKYIYYTYTYCI